MSRVEQRLKVLKDKAKSILCRISNAREEIKSRALARASSKMSEIWDAFEHGLESQYILSKGIRHGVQTEGRQTTEFVQIRRSWGVDVSIFN